MNWMVIAAIVAMVVGLIGLGRWYQLKKKNENERGFVVIAGTVLAMWLFPSSALLILGLVLLLFIVGC